MIATTCGGLIIGGLAGNSVPAAFERALRQGRRAGCILFERHVEDGPAHVAAQLRIVHAAAGPELPLVGVDQEGGRVARLKAPLLAVPPMRSVASWDDVALAERI